MRHHLLSHYNNILKEAVISKKKEAVIFIKKENCKITRLIEKIIRTYTIKFCVDLTV